MRAATELLAGCALIWVLGTWEVRHVWLHALFLVFLIAWSGWRLTTARTPCCHFGAWPQKRSPTQICVQFQNSSAPPRISLPPQQGNWRQHIQHVVCQSLFFQSPCQTVKEETSAFSLTLSTQVEGKYLPLRLV